MSLKEHGSVDQPYQYQLRQQGIKIGLISADGVLSREEYKEKALIKSYQARQGYNIETRYRLTEHQSEQTQSFFKVSAPSILTHLKAHQLIQKSYGFLSVSLFAKTQHVNWDFDCVTEHNEAKRQHDAPHLQVIKTPLWRETKQLSREEVGSKKILFDVDDERIDQDCLDVKQQQVSSDKFTSEAQKSRCFLENKKSPPPFFIDLARGSVLSKKELFTKTRKEQKRYLNLHFMVSKKEEVKGWRVQHEPQLLLWESGSLPQLITLKGNQVQVEVKRFQHPLGLYLYAAETVLYSVQKSQPKSQPWALFDEAIIPESVGSVSQQKIPSKKHLARDVYVQSYFPAIVFNFWILSEKNPLYQYSNVRPFLPWLRKHNPVLFEGSDPQGDVITPSQYRMFLKSVSAQLDLSFLDEDVYQRRYLSSAEWEHVASGNGVLMLFIPNAFLSYGRYGGALSFVAKNKVMNMPWEGVEAILDDRYIETVYRCEKQLKEQFKGCEFSPNIYKALNGSGSFEHFVWVEWLAHVSSGSQDYRRWVHVAWQGALLSGASEEELIHSAQLTAIQIWSLLKDAQQKNPNLKVRVLVCEEGVRVLNELNSICSEYGQVGLEKTLICHDKKTTPVPLKREGLDQLVCRYQSIESDGVFSLDWFKQIDFTWLMS